MINGHQPPQNFAVFCYFKTLQNAFLHVKLFYMRILYLAILLLAASAVAVADVFLRKASTLGSMSAVIRSPLVFGAILFYLFQIAAFAYLFIKGEQLTIVAVVQTALYALITIGAGIFVFRENITLLQLVGIILALSGVVLVNMPGGG